MLIQLNNRIYKWMLKYQLTALAVFASSFLVACVNLKPVEVTPTNFNSNYRLVIPSTTAAFVAIDGLDSDLKWNDAFHLGFVDGTDVSKASMQGVVDANNLYLYFELEEIDYTTTDTLAIVISPDPSDPTDNRLLLVKPCPDTIVCGNSGNNKQPDVIYYTIDSVTGTWDAGVQNPALLANTIKVSTADSLTPGNVHWRVEMMISRTDFNLPATGYFGLYTNILETSLTSFDVTQYTWPFVEDSGDNLVFNDVTNLPSDTLWGNATLDDSSGSGVFVTSSDISTNHGNGSVISTNEENIFSAIAHNAGNNAGDLAEDVTATFRWANFGIPSRSSFHKIPTDADAAARGNPPPAADIPPTGSTTYSFNWSVSDEDPADQVDYVDGSHFCLQVTLDSTSGVSFMRQSAQRNMNFAETSSPFKRKALIDARGIKPNNGKEFHDYIIEEQFYNFKPELKWKSSLDGVRALGNNRYHLQVPVERPMAMALSILPPDEVLVPYKEIKFGNKPIKIPVRNGQLITVLVEKISVEDDDSGAIVRSATEIGGSRITSTENKPSDEIRKPSAKIMASWDGSKESRIFVGRAVSLKAPKNSENLFLNVDAEKETVVQARIYITKLERYNLAANPSLQYERAPTGVVNLGANLPMVVYRAKRNTGKTLIIDEKKFNVYQSAGSFGYIVKGAKTGQ